jgi:hypothetical protein
MLGRANEVSRKAIAWEQSPNNGRSKSRRSPRLIPNYIAGRAAVEFSNNDFIVRQFVYVSRCRCLMAQLI